MALYTIGSSQSHSSFRLTLEMADKLIMPPSPEPVEISHKRWRSKRSKTIVEVVSVHHRQGKHGYYSTVTIFDLKRKRKVTWPAKTFLRVYKPIGRRLKIRTIWERLDRDNV
jgi:hypothetical protein